MDEMKTNVIGKLRPVETKRASEAIYEQVKGLIIAGELRPGDKLPSERDMMDLFARSRPTVREALRMLERSGYVRTVAGSGAIVLKPDDKAVEESVEDALRVGRVSLAELSEYRKVSETATVMWAAQRRSREDLEAMEALLQKMESSMDHFEACIDMDPQFHGLLAAAAGNRISTVMNRTFSKLNRSFMMEKMKTMSPQEQLEMNQRVYTMHRAIYEAVKAQDVELARQIMGEHMDAFGADLQV